MNTPKKDRAKLTKTMYREWDTGDRKNKWGGTKVDGYSTKNIWLCPLYNITSEDSNHVL